MKYLCENIQGCKLGYCQSDEISLLITDYETINTAAWFDYQVQKMCSIAASMATLVFNRVFGELVSKHLSWHDYNNYEVALHKAKITGAMFDARCFSIPKEEVCNYFIWRQQDATRNSIQMVGQANFSHRELQNKSCDKIQDMLMTQKDTNWNDFDTVKKRGSCCTKTGKHTIVDIQTGEQKERFIWEIDKNIPIFTQDRNYIERFV
jgi:tRNA(His) 5'-end guanylyltransferase